MNRLTDSLKDWNKNCYGNIFRKKKHLLARIQGKECLAVAIKLRILKRLVSPPPSPEPPNGKHIIVLEEDTSVKEELRVVEAIVRIHMMKALL